MNWKKQITLLFFMMAVGLTLAGCSQKSETSNPSQTITGENTPEQTYSYNKYQINPYIASVLQPDEQLYKKLFDMVENANEHMDVSNLALNQNTFERTVSALMDRLEFPYVKKIVLRDGKTAVASYSMDKESALAAQNKFRSKVESILSTVVSPSQSQTRNALALYEYLVQNVTYADNALNTGGYDALINGTAICYGYSFALQYLLDQIGIEAQITNSMNESHMWVIAKLDGEYRHLDPTNGWSQFGLSDQAQKRNYDEWYCGNVNYAKETSPSCTDKTFDFLLDSYSIAYHTDTATFHYTDLTNQEREFFVP